MFSGCRLLKWFICVSHFLYRLVSWFSCLNGFTVVISGALYSFTVRCEPNLRVENRTLTFHFYKCDLDKEMSHWESFHMIVYIWYTFSLKMN